MPLGSLATAVASLGKRRRRAKGPDKRKGPGYYQKAGAKMGGGMGSMAPVATDVVATRRRRKRRRKLTPGMGKAVKGGLGG